MKYCYACKETKLKEMFSINKTRYCGLASECRECKKWMDIKRKDGITKEDWEKKVKSLIESFILFII